MADIIVHNPLDANVVMCPSMGHFTDLSCFEPLGCFTAPLEVAGPHMVKYLPPTRQMFYEIALIIGNPQCDFTQSIHNDSMNYQQHGIQFQSPAHTCQWSYGPNDGVQWKGILISFPASQLDWTIANEMIDKHYPFFSSRGRTYLPLSDNELDQIRSWFEQLAAEIKSQHSDKSLMITYLLNVVLQQCVRLYRLKIADNSTPLKNSYDVAVRFENILEEVYSNPDINITAIAERLHISAPYLTKCVRDELGFTPTDLLIKRRLKEAKKLLINSNLPIKTISLVCGYDDWSYFTRSFKSRIGTTPSLYRDQVVR